MATSYPNFITVEIKLTKKLYPIQSDFIKWNPYPGKNQIYVPTKIQLPKNPNFKDSLVDSNDVSQLSQNEKNFTKKVFNFIMKNSKNDKKLSTNSYGSNNHINPFIISEAQKLFTDKELFLKFLKDEGPWASRENYAPKQITIIDVANFIIKTYFIVPGSQIPIILNNDKYLVQSVKEFIPKLNNVFEISDKLNCFVKLHCCNRQELYSSYKSDSFICSKGQTTVCGQIPRESGSGELEADGDLLKTSKEYINQINQIKKKIKDSVIDSKSDEVNRLLERLDQLEKKFKENKLINYPDSPRLYFPESKTLKSDESLEKLMIGLINNKLNDNGSMHAGCVYKFKGKSARDVIKLATTQKWVEDQKELQEISKAAGITTSDAEKKEAFKKYQQWLSNKNINYWCYIINYINHLKLKEGYLECEYTLSLSIDKSVTSKSIKNLRENCKSGKSKLEMQKSCDAICEDSKKNESFGSDTKCLFCKIIMDCGFGDDNQLVQKDAFGRIIKNKSTNLDKTPLDLKGTENYCGENFSVNTNNNQGAVDSSNCQGFKKNYSPKYSHFYKAKTEKDLKDTVVT